jgi:hypothetical protein
MLWISFNGLNSQYLIVRFQMNLIIETSKLFPRAQVCDMRLLSRGRTRAFCPDMSARPRLSRKQLVTVSRLGQLPSAGNDKQEQLRPVHVTRRCPLLEHAMDFVLWIAQRVATS